MSEQEKDQLCPPPSPPPSQASPSSPPPSQPSSPPPTSSTLKDAQPSEDDQSVSVVADQPNDQVVPEKATRQTTMPDQKVENNDDNLPDLNEWSSPEKEANLTAAIDWLLSVRNKTLFESRTRFYITGCLLDVSEKQTRMKKYESWDAQHRPWRILEIDRTTGNGLLQVHEDANHYSEADCQHRISQLSVAHSTTGGLNKRCIISAILGVVRLPEPHILFVTEKDHVATIREHQIYQIKETLLLPLNDPSLQKIMQQQESDEQGDDGEKVKLKKKKKKKKNRKKIEKEADELQSKYLKLFQEFDWSQNCFFSYTYDLTRSAQRQYHACLCNNASYDDMFVWNHLLEQELLESLPRCTYWLQPVIYGFLQQEWLPTAPFDDGNITMTLIARRSRFRYGPRYLRRGVNREGHVANEVESELIVEKCGELLSSHVMTRGSIPLHWSQPTQLNLKPEIIIDHETDQELKHTFSHFENMKRRYGYPVAVVNLIKQERKVKKKKLIEGKLARLFGPACEKTNGFILNAAESQFPSSSSAPLGLFNPSQITGSYHWNRPVQLDINSDQDNKDKINAFSLSSSLQSDDKSSPEGSTSPVPINPHTALLASNTKSTSSSFFAAPSIIGSLHHRKNVSSFDSTMSTSSVDSNFSYSSSLSTRTRRYSNAQYTPRVSVSSAFAPRSPATYALSGFLETHLEEDEEEDDLFSSSTSSSSSSSSLFSSASSSSPAEAKEATSFLSRDQVNSSIEEIQSTAIIYKAYDMLKRKKKSNVDVLKEVGDLVEPLVALTGWFACKPIPPKSENDHTDSTDKEMNKSDGKRDENNTDSTVIQDAYLLQQFSLAEMQQGVVRVNCIDCLDRTNVAMFCVARAGLVLQLRQTYGFDQDHHLALLSRAVDILSVMFTAHGDAIAYQYAGSGAMHREVLIDSRQGKTQQLAESAAIQVALPVAKPVYIPIAQPLSSSSLSSPSSSSPEGCIAQVPIPKDHLDMDTPSITSQSIEQVRPPKPRPSVSIERSPSLSTAPSSCSSFPSEASSSSSSSTMSSSTSSPALATPTITTTSPTAQTSTLGDIKRKGAGVAHNVTSFVKRFYKNNFQDANKLSMLNLVVGGFSAFADEKVHLWDIDPSIDLSEHHQETLNLAVQTHHPSLPFMLQRVVNTVAPSSTSASVSFESSPQQSSLKDTQTQLLEAADCKNHALTSDPCPSTSQQDSSSSSSSSSLPSSSPSAAHKRARTPSVMQRDFERFMTGDEKKAIDTSDLSQLKADHPNLLFVMERSKNKNLVLFEAMLRTNWSFQDNPIDSYWMKIDQEYKAKHWNGKGTYDPRKELNMIEKYHLFGHSCTRIHDEPKRVAMAMMTLPSTTTLAYSLDVVVLKPRRVWLMREQCDPLSSSSSTSSLAPQHFQPRAYMFVKGRLLPVFKIYICLHERRWRQDKVDYVEIYAHDPSNGNRLVVDRYDPQKERKVVEANEKLKKLKNKKRGSVPHAKSNFHSNQDSTGEKKLSPSSGQGKKDETQTNHRRTQSALPGSAVSPFSSALLSSSCSSSTPMPTLPANSSTPLSGDYSTTSTLQEASIAHADQVAELMGVGETLSIRNHFDRTRAQSLNQLFLQR